MADMKLTVLDKKRSSQVGEERKIWHFSKEKKGFEFLHQMSKTSKLK